MKGKTVVSLKKKKITKASYKEQNYQSALIHKVSHIIKQDH